MILSETLCKHLAEADEECNEMMGRLAGQMARKEGVTEQLRSDDWLCWLQKNAYRKEKIRISRRRSGVRNADFYGRFVF